LQPNGPEVFLVSDPDLFNNHGLGRADNAVAFHELLVHRLGAQGVIFDETIHGFVHDPGLLEEAFRFPLVLATLQAFVLVGTVLWAGVGRFGKPLPPPAEAGPPPGKTVLIDNTARLLTRGGDVSEALSQYYRQTTRAVAAHYFLPPDLPEAEIVERLRRIAKARGVRTDLSTLAERIRHLPAAGVRGVGERAVRIARRLHRWRLEMMDGHSNRS
jgi:hypothetical protein